MKYCRVEYGGFAIAQDNEVNSLSMFGVGSGTTLEHIQTKANADDGFEWFGGTAQAKYLLCTYIQDDMFDYSFGFRGKLQYLVGVQEGATNQGERGFEVDNSETEIGTYTDTPRVEPIISNVTLVGPGAQKDAALSGTAGEGMKFRRGCGSMVYNGIVQGFYAEGVDVDDTETCDMMCAGRLKLSHFTFYDNGNDSRFENREDYELGDTHWESSVVGTGECETGGAGDPPSQETGGCSAEQLVQGEEADNNIYDNAANPTGLEKLPGGIGYDLQNLDLRPTEAAGPAIDVSAIDSFFDATTFRGGVDPTNDWTKEAWVSWLQN
jgi:hypothetical protein